jgi:hypothetical protein
MQCSITRQVGTRRSTVLSLSPQLAFPGGRNGVFLFSEMKWEVHQKNGLRLTQDLYYKHFYSRNGTAHLCLILT